ncbi:unnamed protein product [Symbiodinium sp. CCMP2592]|nr:unnamed protein product [Symbiodinium sp. CCMP2592]
MNTFSASILQQLAGVTREQLDGALPPAQATVGPPELPFAPVPDLGDAFPANPSPASASADNWGFVGFTGDFEGFTDDLAVPVSEVEVQQQTHEFPPSPPVGFNPNHFEAHLASLCEPDEQAPSLSLLGSGDENTAWYEDVRAMSESHFSLVPSASKRDFGEEVRPGRIARAVGDERSRTAVAFPALPWERGVFRAIFGDEGLTNPFDNLVLKMPGPLVPAHVPPAEPKIPEPPIPSADIASRAFKSFKDVHPSDERDMVMDRAVCKLQHIICRTDVDRLSPELAQAASSKDATDEVFGIVSACVGLRSPHTVVKRANAILAYLRWCDKEGYEKPFCEDSVWSFISYLKKEKAAPTRAASLISALRFANFVLGLSVSEVLASRRILGLSAQLGVKKKATNRARPFKVSEVRFMHGVLEDESAPIWDRAICAYLLLALYARARHSDLVLVEEVIADFDRQCSGYLEIRLRFHKTAQTIAKKNDLLPVIVSSKGIVKGDWLGLATDVFERVGLTLDGTVGAGLFRPFRPGDTAPGRRSLRSSECTTMLKMVLERAGSDVSMVTSHSLKRTLLDWGSKFCLDDGILALLGRHSKCVKGSVPVYAKEEALKAVRALEPMCQAVAAGSFHPDAARALYFTDPPAPTVVSQAPEFRAAVKAKVEIINDSASERAESEGQHSSSGSESSDSESQDDSDSSSESIAPIKAPRLEIEQWDAADCAANSRTRTLHLLKFVSGGGNLIATCGRTSEVMVQAAQAHMRFRRYLEVLTCTVDCPKLLLLAMSSLIDSGAHFKRRADEVGLSSAGWTILQALGITSVGKAAYTITSPGEPVTEPIFRDWVADNAAGMTLGDQSCLKRLVSESQTLVPIVCITLEGVNMPSNALLDSCCQQERDNLLKYIPPEKALQVEASKIVLKSDADAVEYQPVNALQTMEALRRRGLAMVFAQMISYDAYDRYVNRLFNHLSRDPPPGLNRVNVTQLVNADKQVFALLAEWGVKPRRDTAGEYPLDREMHRALESYEVSIALMHQAPQGKFPFKINRKRHPSRPSTPDPPTKLPKGKGRGKGAKGGPAMPKELVDLKANATTPEGKSICYAFNLKECKRTDCPHQHVCARCFQPHSIRKCAAAGLNNHLGFPNALIPLSQFEAGGLWIEGAGEEVCPDPGHPDAKGHVLQLHEPIQFDAHRLHATCPWTGNRTVLAAFVINDFHKLDAQHRQLLQHTAFRLPNLSTGELLPLRPSIASRFPVVLEIFAGTARVTAALRRCGFVGAQGVDHVVVDHAACPVLLADLTTQEGQRLTMMWLSSPHVIGVFIAPPCGTSSRPDSWMDIDSAQGVRQGCMLAPCLWLLFVAYLFHHLDTTMGGADSWTCQHSTAFADDLHFKWDLDDPKALDRMKMEVATVLSVLKSFGLQISAEKSTMLIEIRGTAADVWLSKNVYKDAENNKHFRYDTFAKLSIPLGTQFKYLGVILSYRNYELASVKHRVQQAAIHHSRLRRILQGRGGISRHQRLRLWRICIQTSQLYGLEATGVTEELLDSLKMASVRQMLSQRLQSANTRLCSNTDLPCYDKDNILRRIQALQPGIDQPICTQRVSTASTAPVQQTQHDVMPQEQKVRLQELPADTKQFRCQVCGQSFPSLHLVKTHEGKAHKILAPKRELPQDRSVYSINGPPQCRFCGYKFTKWSGLQRHIQRNGCPILRHEDPATFATSAPATTNKAEDPLRTTQHAWVADSTIATTMPSTGDQPLVQDAQLQQDASKYTWTKVLHMWRTKHDFTNVCVFCGQWAVDASALKQHYAKQHQALTNPWIAAYRAECKQLAKVAVSKCRFCGTTTTVEMEDMQDFDAESQIQSLLGGLSSVVDLKPLLNPTPTPARNQSHLTNKRPRAEQWTRGTGSKGGGKGKGVASNGTLSQEDLQQLLRQIVILLLRQGDQLNRLQTDTGYYLVFQVPGDATMVPVLIAGALEWRNQKKADPTKLTMSLRIALIGLFLKELQMRLEKIRANDQLQEKLKEQGLMTDEGAWTYRQWCPKNKALQLQLSRDPIKWDVLMTHITNALQGLNNQDHITRFQATKALEEGQMGPTLPFLLDISLKPSACRLHQSMRALVDCSAMEAVGARIRPQRAKRSQLQDQLQEWLRGRFYHVGCTIHTISVMPTLSSWHLHGYLVRSRSLNMPRLYFRSCVLSASMVSKLLCLPDHTAFQALIQEWPHFDRQQDVAEFAQHVLDRTWPVQNVLPMSTWQSRDESGFSTDEGHYRTLLIHWESTQEDPQLYYTDDSCMARRPTNAQLRVLMTEVYLIFLECVGYVSSL